MASRDQILKKLRKAQKPFTDVPTVSERRHMVPMTEESSEDLVGRFVKEAELLTCYVYQVNQKQAYQKILELIGDDTSVLSWSAENIPFSGLHDQLQKDGISVARFDDGLVRVGITGVSGALAGTGSLIVSSGEGRPRTASLLPDLHIAILTPDQILPDFETWVQLQKGQSFPAFTQSSNTTLISGPSKTADIAQELIKGAHGPREVHIIILS